MTSPPLPCGFRFCKSLSQHLWPYSRMATSLHQDGIYLSIYLKPTMLLCATNGQPYIYLHSIFVRTIRCQWVKKYEWTLEPTIVSVFNAGNFPLPRGGNSLHVKEAFHLFLLSQNNVNMYVYICEDISL